MKLGKGLDASCHYREHATSVTAVCHGGREHMYTCGLYALVCLREQTRMYRQIGHFVSVIVSLGDKLSPRGAIKAS